MKLCFVTPTDQRRTVVEELAKQLVERKNYEVMILQPRRRHHVRARKVARKIHPNIETMYFPSIFMPKTNYVIPFLHRQLEVMREILLKRKCEVVQACDYDYLTSIAPVVVKKRCKVPIVLTTDALPGYSWFYGDAIVDAVAKIYTHSIGKRILNSFDAVVLLYKELCNEVKNLGVPPERIFMIPTGINSRGFRENSNVDELRAKLAIKDDEKVLLFVGRLSQVKRVDILIRLTKRLVRAGFRVKTVIVGEGPSRKHFEALSKSVGNFIVFTGYIPHNQISKYYLMADVFILPSLSEGLPTVLLEASAAGKPCVASDVNGVSDIVRHKETGFLAKRSDINSFTHYVKLLLTDPILLSRMGRNAANYVQENFNWSAVVDKYDRIYRYLLD